MILMIDNYDSFTYNVVQYLMELGAEVDVRRNDEISIVDIEQLAPQKIVISPGPCTPNEAGISMQAVERFGGQIPILGICLGHQSIGQSYGGEIVRAQQVMHGKTSMIHHTATGVFSDLACVVEPVQRTPLAVDGLSDCDDGSAADIQSLPSSLSFSLSRDARACCPCARVSGCC